MKILSLGIHLYTQETLLKYIGGLHSYLNNIILMFNPTNFDEVFVLARHVEARKKNPFDKFSKKPFKPTKRKFKGKGKGKKNATVRKEGEKTFLQSLQE